MEHYLAEASVDHASQLIDAMEAAVRHISLHLLSGSPRHATELDILDLRTWPVKGFPYLVFYVAHAQIDVWRVLHAKRTFRSGCKIDEHEEIHCAELRAAIPDLCWMCHDGRR